MINKHIDQNILKSLLDYDELTGIFTWKLSVGSVTKGAIAGCIDGGSGYRMIRIRGVNYSAHRLAFIWMLGKAPNVVDHKNRVLTDNSWLNLRPATFCSNKQNTAADCTNVLGIKGITKNKFGSYHARITPTIGKRISKTFKTLDEAVKFVEEQRKIHHGEFAYIKS